MFYYIIICHTGITVYHVSQPPKTVSASLSLQYKTFSFYSGKTPSKFTCQIQALSLFVAVCWLWMTFAGQFCPPTAWWSELTDQGLQDFTSNESKYKMVDLEKETLKSFIKEWVWERKERSSLRVGQRLKKGERVGSGDRRRGNLERTEYSARDQKNGNKYMNWAIWIPEGEDGN